MVHSVRLTSMLLCAAIVIIWIRSYRVADNFQYFERWRERAVGISTQCGQLHIGSFDTTIYSNFRHWPDDVGIRYTTQQPRSLLENNWVSETAWSRLGFWMGDSKHGPHIWVFSIPLWLPFIVTLPGAIGGARVGSRFATVRRRMRSGCCQRCGYDLRATPDHCPECGTPAQPDVSHASRP